MRWTELKIGVYPTKITKISGEPLIKVSEGYVDKDGNELVEEVISKRKAVWKNKEGRIIENRYKLINEKPMAKFKLIKEVPKEKVKEVSKVEAYDLIVESVYKVECDLLFEHLKKSDKALKFHYSNGNGYKVYIAYITPFGENLIMYLGTDTLNNGLTRIGSIVATQKQKVKVEEEVDSANTLLAEL